MKTRKSCLKKKTYIRITFQLHVDFFFLTYLTFILIVSVISEKQMNDDYQRRKKKKEEKRGSFIHFYGQKFVEKVNQIQINN